MDYADPLNGSQLNLLAFFCRHEIYPVNCKFRYLLEAGRQHKLVNQTLFSPIGKVELIYKGSE